MIQFFRRIRRQLLSENRVTKYLAYAIGEIVLVVIGILIALQLNNANEARKHAIELKAGMVALVKEIDRNIRYVERRIQNIESDMEDIETILHKINTNQADTITVDFIGKIIKDVGPFTYLPLRENAYRNFVNSDLINYIQEDSLKLEIIDIEVGYQIYQEKRNMMANNWETLLKPYYLRHSDLMGINDTLYKKPIPKRYYNVNMAAFINNREFSNILTQRSFAELSSKGDFKILIRRLKSKSALIEAYIAEH